MDIVGQWLDENCELNERAHIYMASLYGNYKVWCEEQGRRPMSAINLRRDLAQRPGLYYDPKGGSDRKAVMRGLHLQHAYRADGGEADEDPFEG